MRLGYGTPITEELDIGEKALWVGQPRGGLILQAGDALWIPVSLLWAGFSVFWEAGVIHSGAPFFMRLWGIPFVLVGIYIVIGRFFFDAWRRSRTYYAVTDQRALIVANGLLGGRRRTSLPFRTLGQVTLTTYADGTGTIFLGASPSDELTTRFYPSGWPGTSTGPAFERVIDAREVYDLIRHKQETPVPVSQLGGGESASDN